MSLLFGVNVCKYFCSGLSYVPTEFEETYDIGLNVTLGRNELLAATLNFTGVFFFFKYLEANTITFFPVQSELLFYIVAHFI